MSSIKPDNAGCEVNSAEENSGGLIVACCDRAVLFESGEEVLDEVPCLVYLAIIVTGDLAVRFAWDHRRLAGGHEGRDDALVGIERLVSDQHAGLHARQQVVCSDEVVGLAASEMKAGRIAERIDRGVYLGAQSPARAPDRLIFAPFLGAPALC